MLFVGSCGGQPVQGEYTIVVHSVADEPLDGANVWFVSTDSTSASLLGVTDSVGIVAFESRELRNASEGAVLVCRVGYYCGGWLVSEGYFDTDKQWMYVELAQETVR